MKLWVVLTPLNAVLLPLHIIQGNTFWVVCSALFVGYGTAILLREERK